MTPRLSAAPAALLTALLVPASAAPQAAEQDPRPDLRAFEAVLDRAVSQVSRVSMSPFLPGVESCHGYHLPGYGAVFVLPPRAFPRNKRLLTARGRFGATSPRAPITAVPEPPDREAGDPSSPPDKAGRDAAHDATPARGRRSEPDAIESELRKVEQQVEAFQRDAEAANRLAEEQLEAIARELRVRMEIAGSPEAQAVPAPPWRFWFETTEPEDLRTPNRVLNDVRAAVTEALQTAGPRLRVVRPEEFLVVAVDFVAGGGFVDPSGPQQTLVVRVKKKDLDDRAAGRVSSEELQKRIEYMTY
jgi:hypothetical protein